mmetsp:Transcript_19452/g.49855  ORF Transcript_19452/g.49855 Transcript_19452/m.49855 type:complete len:146 (-) Transcript_19452:607-1044(-)
MRASRAGQQSFRPRSALVAHDHIFGGNQNAFGLAEKFSSRREYCFDIYSGPLLCATVAKRAGHIRTTTESRLPYTEAHPFADYQQHDSVSEEELLYHLRLSETLFQFLQRCITSGFDIAIGDSLQQREGTVMLRRAFRCDLNATG